MNPIDSFSILEEEGLETEMMQDQAVVEGSDPAVAESIETFGDEELPLEVCHEALVRFSQRNAKRGRGRQAAKREQWR